MRLALISDIHGNLVALEAVLAEIAQQNIAHDSQHILCLGDVAAFGPQPLQVLARLQTPTGYDAHIMVGGHTHMQMFRRHKDMLILNRMRNGLPMNGQPHK